MHNFNLQEKTTSTVEVTTIFVKKFKAHFEKKLNNNFGLDSFCCYTDLLSSSTVEVVFSCRLKLCTMTKEVHGSFSLGQ